MHDCVGQTFIGLAGHCLLYNCSDVGSAPISAQHARVGNSFKCSCNIIYWIYETNTFVFLVVGLANVHLLITLKWWRTSDLDLWLLLLDIMYTFGFLLVVGGFYDTLNIALKHFVKQHFIRIAKYVKQYRDSWFKMSTICHKNNSDSNIPTAPGF